MYSAFCYSRYRSPDVILMRTNRGMRPSTLEFKPGLANNATQSRSHSTSNEMTQGIAGGWRKSWCNPPTGHKGGISGVLKCSACSNYETIKKSTMKTIWSLFSDLSDISISLLIGTTRVNPNASSTICLAVDSCGT